ncbi:MAG: hypothetical protein A2729_03810 [Candidatus Buchananbacteria bacterium RIFCSPHIGHO2_01_FULL_39_14]|uniref:Uncharacterized protein n=2 Tax=Candidatus Buchananiibacteriota TaxID=1817903 RepID=A0A1G1YPH1_9BACT|nr:MAG: hypothetical protein A2729_03810 [Candidatus Buchananbacteria bacterium RIFCSPHIGHO2_01_FULL_39_14]OGY48503.1 MAG: hypothetical protein A3D39_04990 [Candidatus Buchananbacteria bacterium RIFCSPHIGHO2_02_FULL_39_17]OGY54258.1 MAG: hypothetical protein A2912_04420 [Candidatus Buchananbacteria bacterium RIFCSPLOWO2_01_FULL_40_23b]
MLIRRNVIIFGLKNFISACHLVYDKKIYWLISLAIFVLLISFNFLAFDFNWLTYLWQINIFSRFEIFLMIIDVIVFKIRISPIPSLLMISIALAGSLNLTFLLYFIRRGFFDAKSVSTSLSSLILATLGFGCLSCGSIILSSILGFWLSVEIISLFPYQGIEFGIISLLLLFISTFWLAIKIAKISQSCCEVKLKNL